MDKSDLDFVVKLSTDAMGDIEKIPSDGELRDRVALAMGLMVGYAYRTYNHEHRMPVDNYQAALVLQAAKNAVVDGDAEQALERLAALEALLGLKR